MTNIFYFRHINAIGGIETFFYELAKKYRDYDITIFYNTGDARQIRRLRKFVRVIQYTGQHIKCTKAFFNFNLDIIDNVEADEYIQIIHGDYKAMGIKPPTSSKITRYLAVSKIAKKSFEEIMGKPAELCYNPFTPDQPSKTLLLVSATRLSREKGRKRMEKLAQILDDAGVNFLWLVFGDVDEPFKNSKIVILKPRLDIRNFIKKADYLVQLSDNEGYCYSVVEALSLGTPVIVSDCPVFKEIGVKKSTGFILDMELEDVPVEKIAAGLPAFSYTPKKDAYDKILDHTDSTYLDELADLVDVEVTRDYFDIELQRGNKVGYTFTAQKTRAAVLEAAGVAKVVS